MTRLFIDTNVVLDFLMERAGYREAACIIDLSTENDYELVVSVLSMSNIAYVLRKVLRGENLYDALEQLSAFFKVASVTSEDFMGALELKSRDFEDALQYFCAKSYHCDRIVTRNEKDFYFSDIMVCSPVEFLSEIL